MKRIISIFMTFVMCISLMFAGVIPENVRAEGNSIVKIKIGSKTFKAQFYDNETAVSLKNTFPLKVKMSELNGNEKYKYLDFDLPTNEESVGIIQAGDIMLYGDDCIVIFYKSFATPYSYTKIGRITNVKGLKRAAGKGSVKVRFK